MLSKGLWEMVLKDNNVKAKPFVKWVGGKSQLLDEVRRSLPVDLSRRKGITYVEPFVGGGAVLFWILQEFPNIEQAVINDINRELVCTYSVIKNKVEELIEVLAEYQAEYQSLDDNERKDYFLGKRSRYNEHPESDVETAALFIFLNRTCFNGLYRVNSKGAFNVPFGRYANPKICDAETLRADSELLKRVTILCGDFAQTEEYADEHSVFYFDPPYKPITVTSSFTSYSKEGFDDEEQIRLRDFCNRIAEKKALFVASNSDPAKDTASGNFFDNIYQRFSIKRVSASRMINANAAGRGKLSEIMITNII